MKIRFTIFFIILHFLTVAQVQQPEGLSFLHTSGQDIVNASGQKIFLKGVGLGNWLLPEGYMWKFGKEGDRPRKIEQLVVNMIGSEKANSFWKAFRQNYITEEDIKRIAALGFNSVRPALNSRLFLSEDENPVYLDEGFQLMDSLISWCNKYGLYVIIDMHGAPGGQTGANIDDSRNDIPELFIHQKFQDQLVQLWVKIAERYKDEPVVAAYDVLNEPLPINTGAAEKYKHLLEPLYKRITAEIRHVDSKHMITLEGFNWSNDWSVFKQPFDSNVFYQFHYYCWDKPDHLNNIDTYLKKRTELKTPVWVGETGEKNNTIYWATSQYFTANNIGFSFWPWKKMDTQNTPYSIKRPANWQLIADYSAGDAKPESFIAEKILNELLQNIKFSNCVYYEDVCNAIFTRIPAKIEAENYGHNGFNRSYFVSNQSALSAYYRKEEPVQIVLDSKDADQFLSEQSVILNNTEWVQYDFESLDNKKHRLIIKAAALKDEVKATIWINNKKLKFTSNNTAFSEKEAGYFFVKKGSNTIKIQVRKNQLKLDWLRLD